MLDLSEINKKNICIMGLMGSGKSIIGKDLSKYLNLNFYDTDKEIELKTKKKINEIFEEKGELVRKLVVSNQINNSIDYEFEEKDFRLSMLEDQMASEKLSEGITGFSKAIEELEELLLKRYSEIKNHKLISAN